MCKKTVRKKVGLIVATIISSILFGVALVIHRQNVPDPNRQAAQALTRIASLDEVLNLPFGKRYILASHDLRALDGRPGWYEYRRAVRPDPIRGASLKWLHVHMADEVLVSARVLLQIDNSSEVTTSIDKMFGERHRRDGDTLLWETRGLIGVYEGYCSLDQMRFGILSLFANTDSLVP